MSDLQVIVAGRDDLARQLVALRFARHGVRVVERPDGEGAARELLRRSAGTAVVLVGELGDGTPAAFAEWVLEHASTARVPVVVVAPGDRPELASDARAAGAAAAFTLPMDLDEVVERSLELLPEPRAIGAPALIAA